MLFYKKILKSLIWIVSLTTLLSICFYYYLKFTYTDVVSEKRFQELVININSAKSLPEPFYDLYNIEYPGSLDLNYNSTFLYNLFNNKKVKSPFTELSKTFLNKCKIFERSHFIKKNEISLCLNLKDEVNPKQCLNWLFENGLTNDLKTSPKDFLEKYYGKRISEFNTEELAGIIVILKNPYIYNPYRKKDRFDLKVSLINRLYQEQKNKK